MKKWLEGKFKSVKFRILFTFWLILLVVFFGIGWFLDGLMIATKTHHMEQHFYTQSNVFRSCLNSEITSEEGKLNVCSNALKQGSTTTNLYLFHLDNSLAWKIKQYPSDIVYSRALVSQLSAQALSARVVLRMKDSFVTSFALNNQKILILSTPLKAFDADVLRSRGYLGAALLLNVLLLMTFLAWVINRALKPLDKMVFDLEKIGSGEAERLKDGDASEFVVMRDSVNNLLSAEQKQRERYRNTLADLAHSLKTPLAVIQGAANEQLDYESYLKVASEQIRRMDQIIQYQLTRAVKSINDGTKTQSVKLVPIIERILSALAKVYREKEVRVILSLEHSIELNADERDLMEMLGNMLENAFKYSRSEVAVSAYSDSDNVFIVIEDDGGGVSENLRHTILERGERADTSSAPGQGIGLSVSVDILSSYNCRLEVEDSFSLGGAKFSITFPKS